MTELQHDPDSRAPGSTAVAELTRGYVNLRSSYAEAATRATTETELSEWHGRTARMKRYWAGLEQDNLAEVLDAIAAVHAEQRATNTYIAAQIAAAQASSLHTARLR